MLWRIHSFAAGVAEECSPFLRSRSSSGSWKPRQGRSPAECVSRWRTVTASFSRSPKAGRCFATGSSRSTAPSSTSSSTAVVVAITLVSDARSKIVSRAIGTRSGRTHRVAAHAEVLERLAVAPHAREHDGAGDLRRLDRLVERAVHARELAPDRGVPHRSTPASSTTQLAPLAVDRAARADGPGEVRAPVAEGQAERRAAGRAARGPPRSPPRRSASRASGRRSSTSWPNATPAARSSFPAASELLEHAVDRVRLLGDVLEQEDRAVGVDLEGRAEARRHELQRAADEAALGAPAAAALRPRSTTSPARALERRAHRLGLRARSSAPCSSIGPWKPARPACRSCQRWSTVTSL